MPPVRSPHKPSAPRAGASAVGDRVNRAVPDQVRRAVLLANVGTPRSLSAPAARACSVVPLAVRAVPTPRASSLIMPAPAARACTAVIRAIPAVPATRVTSAQIMPAPVVANACHAVAGTSRVVRAALRVSPDYVRRGSVHDRAPSGRLTTHGQGRSSPLRAGTHHRCSIHPTP